MVLANKLVESLQDIDAENVYSKHSLSKKIYELAQFRSFPCVSIFLPVERGWPKRKKNRLLLNENIKNAEFELNQRMSKHDVDSIMTSIKKFSKLDVSLSKENFKGLAFYLSKNVLEILPLEITLEPSHLVGKYFDLKPLLLRERLIDFFILWLNPKGIQLFEVGSTDVKNVPIEGCSTSINEFTKYFDFEKTKQMHQVSGIQRPTHIKHGQGSKKDYKRTLLNEFCKHIETSLTPRFNSQSKPLVLVGSIPMVSNYKNANHYRDTKEFFLSVGNKMEFNEAVEKSRLHFITKEIEKVNDLLESPKVYQVNSDWNVSNFLKKAYQGRIKEVFVDAQEYYWGYFDEKSNIVESHSERVTESEDLINQGLVEVIRNGGNAHSIKGLKKNKGSYAIFELY